MKNEKSGGKTMEQMIAEHKEMDRQFEAKHGMTMKEYHAKLEMEIAKDDRKAARLVEVKAEIVEAAEALKVFEAKQAKALASIKEITANDFEFTGVYDSRTELGNIKWALNTIKADERSGLKDASGIMAATDGLFEEAE